MNIVERPSPNHDTRNGQAVDILLLHYTGMRSGEEALERLCDPDAEPGRVSAHYCIDEDGRVFRLVPEERRAWHAGVASWAGATDINARSIGIELVNPGHEFGYRPFPEPQMRALVSLAGGILDRHQIPARRVLGHSDVAPARKEDPGELFDWPRLAAAGIGLWPSQSVSDTSLGASDRNLPDQGGRSAPPNAPPDIGELQGLLSEYGYDVPSSGVLDEATRLVVRAFHRHYRPEQLSGGPDAETLARLRSLLDKTGWR